MIPTSLRATARKLDHQRRRMALGDVRDLCSDGGLQIAVYDDDLDVLRLIDSPGELVWLADRVEIADSSQWLKKAVPFVRPGGIVFDVGGYKGITAQFFANIASVVHVFEPTPGSAANIARVIRARKLTNIILHQCAVSDREGSGDLNLLEVGGHNSLAPVTTSKRVGAVNVQTVSLDGFAAAQGVHQVDFLKIDVEGYEFEVLSGASRMLAEGRIHRAFFEVNPPLVESIGKSFRPIHELLQRHGYILSDLDRRPVDLDMMEKGLVADALATAPGLASTLQM